MAKQTSRKADLGPQDWVVAALQALIEGGVEAVRVEPLAASLGVTKGSFYWHFKDRPALLGALLDFWEAEFTGSLIEQIADGPGPAARLRSLARMALVADWQGIDNARSEMAMQAWAARDPAVAERLRRIYRVRIDYLQGELAELGFAEGRSSLMAKAIYQALMGLYAARTYDSKLASDEAFLALVELVLAETRWNR
jgi:AcrR family transcriptional regulator